MQRQFRRTPLASGCQMKNMKQQLIRQILWNRLIAVVEEQANVLLKTAFGPITREAGDLSAGVYDTRGRMLAQAGNGTPGPRHNLADAGAAFLQGGAPPPPQTGD